jgi:hypothetical protein
MPARCFPVRSRTIRTAAVAALLVAAACLRTVPLTPDLRDSMVPSGGLAGMSLRLLGTFELRGGGGPSFVVVHDTPLTSPRAIGDTTIMVRMGVAPVAGGNDTLDLTFTLNPTAGGSYTLRAINGAPLGRSITVGGISYSYVPCYQNVGSKCLNPIADGTREDRQVRLGIRPPR